MKLYRGYMGNKYQPEIGQAVFRQPFKEFECPSLLIAVLRDIDLEMNRVQWNILQEEYPSPFENTGSSFNLPEFSVQAYSWGDEEQPYNFKWNDIEISWYKYLGRGTTINRRVDNDEIAKLHEDCINALLKYEKSKIHLPF